MSHQLVVELGGGGGGGGGASSFRVTAMSGEVPAPATLAAETTIVFSPTTKSTVSLNSPSVTGYRAGVAVKHQGDFSNLWYGVYGPFNGYRCCLKDSVIQG